MLGVIKYSRMNQVKFVEYSLEIILSDMICFNRRDQLKFFRGCIPQILLGLFLNTLFEIIVDRMMK